MKTALELVINLCLFVGCWYEFTGECYNNHKLLLHQYPCGLRQLPGGAQSCAAHDVEVGVVLLGQGRVHLMRGHADHAGPRMLLLPLHLPVLEPDFYLTLCQA